MPVEVKLNQNVIDRLEDLLEQAKKGEIQSSAFVLGYPGEYTGNGWEGMYINNIKMIGELRMLERDLIDCCTEPRVNPRTGEENE